MEVLRPGELLRRKPGADDDAVPLDQAPVRTAWEDQLREPREDQGEDETERQR